MSFPVVAQEEPEGFDCTQYPGFLKPVIGFAGAVRLGGNTDDVFRCGPAESPTPSTCELFNRVYTSHESACVNAEIAFPGDYLPGAYGPDLQNYISDYFTPPNWSADLGLPGQDWFLLWDHIAEPDSPDCIGFYAGQSDLLIFGESGDPRLFPCTDGSFLVSCVEPGRVSEAKECNPQTGTPVGDIKIIGGIAPVPVPVVDSVYGGCFEDAALSIALHWLPPCAVTSHDGSPDPVMGYRLEAFPDANGNGMPEPPPVCDPGSELFVPLFDIAPVAKTDDAIPDRTGDRFTTSVTLGLADLVAALPVDPAAIEAMSFRLRLLFQDDRDSPLGPGGYDGIINPVLSAASIRSLPLYFEPEICIDADGDEFGLPGDLACPAGGRTDCNDADPAVNPGAQEFLDGIDNDCDGIVDEITVDPVCEIVPSSLNLQSRGTGFSIKTTLTNLENGQILNPAFLSPVHLSRIASPGLGEILLPVPRAATGCDDLTEDGIWENTIDRSVTGTGTMTLRFNQPSDGQCETMDGNRQDLIGLLLDVPDGDTAQVCYRGTYPGMAGPFECCGTVAVTNHGNR
jgi:hypothetical protein